MSHEHWVPTEIIVEILLKLPIKYLLRCKSVCKRWYVLISGQRFIKSHLTLSLCNTHYRFISIDEISFGCRLYDLETFGESFNIFELDNPFTAKDARARIIGSCNGLLCIMVNKYSTIFICNPSTRRVNMLPYFGPDLFGNEYAGFDFGYDESNDDYKVVKIFGCQSIHATDKMAIYSLKSGCWKTLGDFPRGFPRVALVRALGMYLNGALHWMTGYRDWRSSNYTYLGTIVSFDLATETFGEILQPVYDEGHNYLTLRTLGEWLSVICDYRGNRSDVWVMKVYGVQDSWTKLFSISHVTYNLIPKFVVPLCISHDKKVLLKLKKELVLYDSNNSSFSVIQKFDHGFRAHSFVESLVSPMPSSATIAI